MVVAVQQLLAECTAIFAMCILKHHPQPQLSFHQLPTYVEFFFLVVRSSRISFDLICPG